VSYTPPKNHPLWPQFVTEVKDVMQKPDIDITIPPFYAYTLIGMLQFVLRHPHIPDASREAAESIARQLQSIFDNYPAIATVLEQGWNPEYDEPIPPERGGKPERS
jgi:hypothetical protein